MQRFASDVLNLVSQFNVTDTRITLEQLFLFRETNRRVRQSERVVILDIRRDGRRRERASRARHRLHRQLKDDAADVADRFTVLTVASRQSHASRRQIGLAEVLGEQERQTKDGSRRRVVGKRGLNRHVSRRAD